MSEAPGSAPAVTEEPIDAQQVAEFLRDNPLFFNHNAEVLANLEIPHQAGGSISLIERQVSALREENSNLKRKLGTLISNAQDNDELFHKTRNLILKLMQACKPAELVEAVETAMIEDFNANLCRFFAVGNHPSVERSLERAQIDRDLGRFAPGKQVFCGLLKEHESQLLFGAHAAEAGSAAVLPLVYEGELIAILAIANNSRDYYRDNMDTSILSYVGDVISHAYAPLIT